MNTEQPEGPPKLEKPKKDKKDKKKKASRTTETLFRSLMSNHIQLSTLADRKANLMISVNAIVLSVVATLLLREVRVLPILIWPTVVLMVVCLLTITFAVLATKPSLGPAKADPDQFDLLFFGDYTALSADEYQLAMQTLLQDETRLHDSLIANIYAQGTTLKLKYKRLKTAYTLFMYGFPVAIILFLVVYLTGL
ncbi:MAG: metal-dependent phosphohydrolase [Cytophagales bacterium]|nr:MAG: metal-dependent phosphohydrolase [Cytophagales bacterium]